MRASVSTFHYPVIDLYADHDVYKNDFLVDWQRIAKFRKPTIAAVSGYAVRVHYSLSLTA